MTRHNAKGLLRDRRGVVGAWVALMLVMLLGVAALAVDMGFLWVVRNRLQSTADASALAGASQLGVDEATVKAETVTYAQKNLPPGSHGTALADADVVLGHWDADTRTFILKGTTAGPGQACSNPVPQETDPNCLPLDAVKVTTRRAQANGNPVQLYFARVLGIETADVVTEATAWSPSGGSDVACVIALNPSGTSISISGSANLNFLCGMAANSTSSQSLSVTGESSVVVSDITLVGDYYKQPDSVLEPLPVTDAPETPDPLDHLVVPSYSDCDYNLTRVSANATLSPGVYCGGLETKDGANVTLSPGVYILDGGEPGLLFAGGSTVEGDGVTLILTNNAKADISGLSTVTLSAPTSGTYAGVLIFQDPNAPTGGDPNMINGDSLDTFTGALYFPNQFLQFQGSANLSSSCMQIIARDLEFSGDVTVGNECESMGYAGLGGGYTLMLVD